MFLKPAQKSIFRNKLSIFLIFLLLFFIVGSFVPFKVYASFQCTGYGDVDKVCNNGPSNTSSGGCGDPCGKGSAWTKYQCKEVEGPDYLKYGIVRIGDVCSTGDKCVPGETGLRPGYCDCGTSGPIYKTCCSGSTPVACHRYSVQDNFDPPEGTCAPNTYVYGDGTSCPSTPSPLFNELFFSKTARVKKPQFTNVF